MASRYHLAQLNIARMRGPLDAPVMAGFVAQLEHINDVADRSEGFVWRLQTPEGDATGVRAAADPRIIVNMSVWESLEALEAYVYRSEHLAPLRARTDWFEKWQGPHLVLWWVLAGTTPRVEEGMARLRFLDKHGPSPKAFTFKRPFPQPGAVKESDESNRSET